MQWQYVHKVYHFSFFCGGTQTNSMHLVLDLCTSLPENCKHATNLIFFKRKNREAICKVKLRYKKLVSTGRKIIMISIKVFDSAWNHILTLVLIQKKISQYCSASTSLTSHSHGHLPSIFNFFNSQDPKFQLALTIYTSWGANTWA